MLQQDVSLKPFNTFGVEARARWFARVTSVEQLGAVLADARVAALPRSASSASGKAPSSISQVCR